MKICIAAIGKTKANAAQMKLANSYIKRLPWSVQFKEAEEKKLLPAAQLKEKEAALLLASAPSGGVNIVLDEHGKNLSSQQFAALIERYQNDGHSQFNIFIGGAHGHGEALKEKADISLSFGSMTWPHMLVRAMLAEQLYRAYTILSHHPYHKE